MKSAAIVFIFFSVLLFTSTVILLDKCAAEKGQRTNVESIHVRKLCTLCHKQEDIQKKDHNVARYSAHGIFEAFSFVISFIGTLVIFCGAVMATYKLIRKQEVLKYLGERILIGLEFLIAAEVISTVFFFLVPFKDTQVLLSRIGALFMLVVIRIILGYFLLKQEKWRKKWRWF